MQKTIGSTLSGARRTRNVTLADAAAATHIREVYLVALEDEDWAKIGGRAYARSFLQLYAEFLHINPKPLIDRFDMEVKGEEDTSSLSGLNVESINRIRRRILIRRLVSAGALLGGVVLVIMIFVSQSALPILTDDQLAPAPVEGTPLATTQDVTLPLTQEQLDQFPEHERKRRLVLSQILAQAHVQTSTGIPMGPPVLTIEVNEPSTVTVLYPVGEEPVELQPGDVLTVTDSDAVQLVLSRPQHGVVSVNGKMLPPIGLSARPVKLTCIAKQVACEAVDM